MSKASDWAQAAGQHVPGPEFKLTRGVVAVWRTDTEYGLHLTGKADLTVKEAQALALWIIDTFGEGS